MALKDNCVGWYSFDKTNELADSSSKGNNIVKVGNPYSLTSGGNPNNRVQLTIDASNYMYLADQNYLSFTNGGGDDTAMSISGFFYTTIAPTGQQIIINKATGLTTNVEYRVQITSNKLRLTLSTGSNVNTITIEYPTNIVINTLYHFVFTYNGNNSNTGMNIYINGSLVGSPTRSSAGTYTGMNNLTSNVSIGAVVTGTTAVFSGYLDSIGLWNRELTASEVSQLYNSGAGLNPNFGSNEILLNGYGYSY